MIAMRIENHLDDAHKSESFKIQKLQLKEIITLNDIVHDALNALLYSICSIMFQYHFIIL